MRLVVGTWADKGEVSESVAAISCGRASPSPRANGGVNFRSTSIVKERACKGVQVVITPATDRMYILKKKKKKKKVCQ